MPLKVRRSTVLMKIEGTYAQDPTPTGAANAILVRNLEIQPLKQELIPRDIVRPFLGAQEKFPACRWFEMTFEIELAGSGTAGVAPAWGIPMRACGNSETLLVAAHNGTATAGGASTITLAAGASAVDNAYKGMRIVTTGGTGSGQTRSIASYVGATKVATVASPWTTPPDLTTIYSIGAQTTYLPISTGEESVTSYVNYDGVLHKSLGIRGGWNLKFPNRQFPTLDFSFIGLYVAVADGALPNVTLSPWKKPVPVNKTNTTPISLHGYAIPAMSDFSMSSGNDVKYRNFAGGTEDVQLVDRNGSGSIEIEAPTIAQKDYFSIVDAGTQGALAITHGLSAGNIIGLDSAGVQITEPAYVKKDGIYFQKMGLLFVPSDSGNDEWALTAA